jgi:hypothetical protein
METLQTTNVFVGIIAVVSLLQLLLLVAALVVGYRAYAAARARLDVLERQSVSPLLNSATDILSDLKAMTSRLNARTARVDQTMRDTGERVNDTADRVKSRVRSKVMPFLAFLREVREAWREEAEHDEPRRPR